MKGFLQVEQFVRNTAPVRQFTGDALAEGDGAVMATMQAVFIRRNRLFQNAKVLRNEVDRTLEQVVGGRLLKIFRAHVADWKHKPTWKATLKTPRNTSELTVIPSGTNAKLWVWTSRGTKPHRIAARRARTLAFQTNYSARTQPVGRYGVGTGKSTGPWVYPRAVSHPGTKARKFEETVIQQEQAWFFRTMNQAVRRGVRMMQA